MQTSGMGESQNQSNKSSVGNTEYDLPSDLTGIVHAVINKIHTCGASRSSDPSLQLKSTLPAFCTLNRSVTKALQQVMQTAVWLHSVCMNHQVHCKLIHQQSVNVPAEIKMLGSVNQSSHLIAPDERYDDWTFRTHRGSNPIAADDDVARVYQYQLSFLLSRTYRQNVRTSLAKLGLAICHILAINHSLTFLSALKTHLFWNSEFATTLTDLTYLTCGMHIHRVHKK